MNKQEAISKAKSLHPKWVAEDEDGSWWGYYSKPEMSEHCRQWNYNNTADRLSKPDNKIHPEWRKSLTKI